MARRDGVVLCTGVAEVVPVGEAAGDPVGSASGSVAGSVAVAARAPAVARGAAAVAVPSREAQDASTSVPTAAGITSIRAHQASRRRASCGGRALVPF